MENKKLIIGGIRCENNPVEAKWIRRYTGEWEILFMLEGALHLSYHGKELTLTAGERRILIYAPGFVYRFKGGRGTKYIFVHLKLRPEIEKMVKLDGSIEGLESFSLTPAMHRRIKRDMLEITELVERHIHKCDMAALALAESVILRVTESGNDTGSDTFKLSRSFAMLTGHRNFSMDEIAGSCGLSISAFYQLFKQETGLSPRSYREHSRLFEAARMLRETDLTLREIADEINIYDQYYLSKRFSKLYGMAPSAYRKAQRMKLKEAAGKTSSDSDAGD